MAAKSRPTAWKVVAGTVPGPGHVKEGRPSDDRWAQQQVAPGVQVLAVADGAGSRAGSGQGADAAVQASVAAAREVFGRGAPGDAEGWHSQLADFQRVAFAKFDHAVGALAGARLYDGAKSGARGHGDFATTLTAVVLATPWIGIVHVGDCFAAVRRRDGSVHLVLPPPLEREHSGATTFLTSAGRDDAVERLVVEDADVDGVAVCSDGLLEATLGLAPDGSYWVAPPAFETWFKFAMSSGASAMDLQRKFDTREFAATSPDDKTMVLAVRS